MDRPAERARETVPTPASALRVVIGIWILVFVGLLLVVVVSSLARPSSSDAAIVKALSLDAVVSSPSGTLARTPWLAHPAVPLVHGPGASTPEASP